MIKVEKIQIEEFRGIRSLTLEFNGKNFAVSGPNGTGKSGIVDALEFALTGNISRLSGKGMGNISVKDHAPHVDSRNSPERARVIITFRIPSLANKQVTLERSVKNATLPKITPTSPEILEMLKQFEGHPEFVLSRREIIRYVISTPGDRSEEVQALLRLDQIGDLRSNLKTISNASEKEERDFKKIYVQARDHLAQTLEIPEPGKDKLLEAVNVRRVILGLAPIEEFTATTCLSDGLETNVKSSAALRIDKTVAIASLKTCRELLQKLSTEHFIAECSDLKKELEILNKDPLVTKGVSREKFLRSSIDLIDETNCPVCGTEWNITELKNVIQEKLKKFEEISKKRNELEHRLEFLIDIINEIKDIVSVLEKLVSVIAKEHTLVFSTYRTGLATNCRALKDFIPLTDSITVIENLFEIPEEFMAALRAMETAVAAIPEPTQQDAARDYLVRAQDRLETYRNAARDAEKAKQHAELTGKVYDTYVEVSTKVLEGVYKEVEAEFSELYRAVNSEDEGNFTAQLAPSIGKLGFDVDFYGRGHFPPGAYHSEGHQDAMGVCLYLALMKRLQGNNFNFAVLDDVLMSVDTNHRREVCRLLKKYFPGTQFILTTHDEVWLKLMVTVGLMAPENTVRFSNWTPDNGPTEWKNRDVWSEIEDALGKDDVRSASSLLRYYLEHIFKEVCDSLRVRVEFKGNGHYELGDTLAPAVRRFRDLIDDGKKAADAWGKTDISATLVQQEKNLANSFLASGAEQWQINTSVHYNEWANFTSTDFRPVVTAFHELVKKFFCDKSGCDGLFYLVTTIPKTPDTVRCACGSTNINLKTPEKGQKIKKQISTTLDQKK